MTWGRPLRWLTWSRPSSERGIVTHSVFGLCIDNAFSRASSAPFFFFNFLTRASTAFSAHFSSSSPCFHPRSRFTYGEVRLQIELILSKNWSFIELKFWVYEAAQLVRSVLKTSSLKEGILHARHCADLCFELGKVYRFWHAIKRERRKVQLFLTISLVPGIRHIEEAPESHLFGIVGLENTGHMVEHVTPDILMNNWTKVSTKDNQLKLPWRSFMADESDVRCEMKNSIFSCCSVSLLRNNSTRFGSAAQLIFHSLNVVRYNSKFFKNQTSNSNLVINFTSYLKVWSHHDCTTLPFGSRRMIFSDDRATKSSFFDSFLKETWK